MVYKFAFEKLEVWRNAMDLSVKVYQLTSKFPKTELFALTDQLRRAVTSVSANVAEGSARATGKDQAHFTTIAYSSLMETLNHLILSVRLEYVTEGDVEELRCAIEVLAKQLSALRKSQMLKL